WSPLAPTGTPPSPRSRHRAVYDPLRDRMLVFGGLHGTRLNDTWALSLSGTLTWSELTPGGPLPPVRTGHGLLYDPLRDRLVVFGGLGSGSAYLNDVWGLPLAGASSWSPLSPSGAPPAPRTFHTAIYDPGRDAMIVFGGEAGLIDIRNDAWSLSLGSSPAWV